MNIIWKANIITISLLLLFLFFIFILQIQKNQLTKKWKDENDDGKKETRNWELRSARNHIYIFVSFLVLDILMVLISILLEILSSRTEDSNPSESARLYTASGILSGSVLMIQIMINLISFKRILRQSFLFRTQIDMDNII